MPRIESDWVPFRDEVGPLGAAAPAHQLMSHTENAAWTDTISARNVCFAFVYWHLGWLVGLPTVGVRGRGRRECCR